MRNPDDRSPAEWAEDLRICAVEARDGDMVHHAWAMTAAECEELAERMDDLEEALRLLRDGWNWTPEIADKRDALLERYEEERK
jgi:hypothetical protein